MWFQRAEYRDLTGDGRIDTLLLTATGTRPESLHVQFTIRSAGRTVYEETWSSAYYFAYDAPVESIPTVRVRSAVSRHLGRFFAAESFGRLSSADSAEAFDILPYEVCGDSVARGPGCPARVIARTWRDLLASARVTFTFFSGGEYTRTIAWSRRARRFYVVFSCC